MKGKPEIFSENGVKMEENHSRVTPEENRSRIKRREKENNTVKKHFTTLQKTIAFIGSILGLVTASITIYNFTHPKPTSTTDSKKPQVVVEKKTIIKEKSSTSPNANTNKESIPTQNYYTSTPSSQDTAPSSSTPNTNTQVENSSPQTSTAPSSETPTTTPSSENINNTSENNTTITSSEENNNNIDNTNKGENINE